MQTYKEEIRTLLKQDFPWERLIGKTIMISGATGMIGKCIVDILMQCNHERRIAKDGEGAVFKAKPLG